MSNGCFLSKNRTIKGLIYQLDNGITPSEFTFSENIADAVQLVNEKLLEQIARERNKSQDLSEKLKIEQSALADLKKSNEETTKQLLKFQDIFSQAGPLNGLSKFFCWL